jgi:hypothetical protein
MALQEVMVAMELRLSAACKTYLNPKEFLHMPVLLLQGK